jgi:hypothetical protein
MLGPLGPDDVVEPRELEAEHLALEEEQGAQGLVRNAVTSGAPISAGWRLAWKKMYRLIQWTYAFSVRRL